MVDTSLEHKIRGAIKINDKEFDLYLNKERAVLKLFRDFINKQVPLKIITEYNSKNPFANYIRETLSIVKPKDITDIDNIGNKELPLLDLLHILNNVPELTLRLENKEITLNLDCFKFTVLKYKIHYRYKWGLYIGDDNKLVYEPIKTFKKKAGDNKDLRYFIIFVKNIGEDFIEDIDNTKDISKDFLPITFK